MKTVEMYFQKHFSTLDVVIVTKGWAEVVKIHFCFEN